MNLFYTDISGSIAIFLIALDIGLRIAALLIIPNNRRPSSAAAWLLAIFFIPVLGVIAFWLIGSPKLPKKRRKKQAYITSEIRKLTENAITINDEIPAPNWLLLVAKLNANLGALPLVGGNRADLVEGYNNSIKAMTKDILKAKDFVNVSFYIMSLDKTTKDFFDALVTVHKKGVKVRVLFDHVGSLQYPDYKKTVRFLKEAGIDWHLMLPVQPLKGKFQRPDLRNHRKILVCDGTVGYTGSQNIIDKSYNKKKNIKKGVYWKELMVRVEGLVATELNGLFASDWYAETNENIIRHNKQILSKVKDYGDVDCQIIPSGPGFDSENNLKLFNSLMYNAQKDIIISSPYFVPEESMLMALTTASERGINVELFVSEIGDQFMVYHAQRSYYETLLRAGVKIFLYKSPAVLHAKHMTIDNKVSIIGSSNMDIRSFGLNMEVTAMFHSEDFANRMHAVEASYRSSSKKLHLKDWVNRPYRQKVVDNLARLTSALQ